MTEFYNDNKSTYSLNDEAIVYNEVVFNDESKAILFRNTLLESDWNRTMNVFRGDSSISFVDENRFRFLTELTSPKLIKILQVLNDGEVSIILEDPAGSYMILQVIHKLGIDEIPELKFIKEKVVDDYMTLQKNKGMKSIFFMFLFTASIFSQQVLDKIVAVVDNEIILQSELNGQVAYVAAQKRLNPNDENLKKQILNAMIEEKLLYAQAERDWQ